MRFLLTVSLWLLGGLTTAGQSPGHILRTFPAGDDILVTVDNPSRLWKKKATLLVFYALPNGNTTGQTMGKKMEPGDDWHFDIQHTGAQTAFIRSQLKRKNVVVIYLANHDMSWPRWKQRHPDFSVRIPQLVDSLAELFGGRKYSICLNGHSGGGSFIFGYLAGVPVIPPSVKRISFIDSNYGYDSSYYPKLRDWILGTRGSALNVFAYDDSVALYNGRPVVSATGGTWYRSHIMLRHFAGDLGFTRTVTDSIIIYRSLSGQVQFFLKPNPDRGIYHTKQVELNGFIHSILCGTRYDSRGYRYYAGRAYSRFIR